MPSLRLLNVLAVTFVLVAPLDRHRRRSFLSWMALAATLDACVMLELLSHRHVIEQTAAGLAPLQMVHVFASALFPLLYPFVLLEAVEAREDGGGLPASFPPFLVLRLIGFVTSYFMAG